MKKEGNPPFELSEIPQDILFQIIGCLGVEDVVRLPSISSLFWPALNNSVALKCCNITLSLSGILSSDDGNIIKPTKLPHVKLRVSDLDSDYFRQIMSMRMANAVTLKIDHWFISYIDILLAVDGCKLTSTECIARIVRRLNPTRLRLEFDEEFSESKNLPGSTLGIVNDRAQHIFFRDAPYSGVTTMIPGMHSTERILTLKSLALVGCDQLSPRLTSLDAAALRMHTFSLNVLYINGNMIQKRDVHLVHALRPKIVMCSFESSQNFGGFMASEQPFYSALCANDQLEALYVSSARIFKVSNTHRFSGGRFSSLQRLAISCILEEDIFDSLRTLVSQQCMPQLTMLGLHYDLKFIFTTLAWFNTLLDCLESLLPRLTHFHCYSFVLWSDVAFSDINAFWARLQHLTSCMRVLNLPRTLYDLGGPKFKETRMAYTSHIPIVRIASNKASGLSKFFTMPMIDNDNGPSMYMDAATILKCDYTLWDIDGYNDNDDDDD